MSKLQISYDKYNLKPSFTQYIYLNSYRNAKKGNFFGLILTFSPVLGFRPVYPPYFLTKKEQRPRISTRSPLASASAILLKNRFTTASASYLDRLFESFSTWMRSILFMRSMLLQIGLLGKWRIEIVGRIER